jgi:hypothetical protein
MLMQVIENKTNAIWDIKKVDGSKITSQQDLKKEAIGYFWNIFKDQENLSISKQLEVIKAYPRIFSEEEGHRIADLVTISEVLSTLKGFVVSKSPGPDGWTVEFFWSFFYLLGHELLGKCVEPAQNRSS